CDAKAWIALGSDKGGRRSVYSDGQQNLSSEGNDHASYQQLRPDFGEWLLRRVSHIQDVETRNLLCGRARFGTGLYVRRRPRRSIFGCGKDRKSCRRSLQRIQIGRASCREGGKN